MKLFHVGLAVVFFSLVYSCNTDNKDFQKDALDPEYIHKAQDNLSNVLIHNIFSPPVASRNVVYPSIAAYEVARHLDSTYTSLAGKIRHLETVPEPIEGQTYC